MPRGDESKYTDKQERKADHIAESYEERGVPEREAERRAWATVNKDDGGKDDGGGKKSGSGRGARTGHPAAHKGGEAGGAASASRSAAERSASAKKAVATRKRNADHAQH
jgi:plasmid stabilization system protein ParE